MHVEHEVHVEGEKKKPGDIFHGIWYDAMARIASSQRKELMCAAARSANFNLSVVHCE